MGKDSRQPHQKTLDQIVERGRNERADRQRLRTRHLTDEQFGRIADAAGVTDPNAMASLLLKVESAVGWFLSDNRTPKRPTPSAMEKQAEDVEKAAQHLLKALGLDDTDDPYDGMPPGSGLRERLEWAARPDGVGEKEVRDLVANVGQLRDLATAVREDAIKNKTKPQDRHRGDEDLNEFILTALTAYTETTNRPISVSQSRAVGAYGPTVRYVRACLNALVQNFPELEDVIGKPTDEALAHRIKTAKKMLAGPSPKKN